jgi:hypothetical protein
MTRPLCAFPSRSADWGLPFGDKPNTLARPRRARWLAFRGSAEGAKAACEAPRGSVRLTTNGGQGGRAELLSAQTALDPREKRPGIGVDSRTTQGIA